MKDARQSPSYGVLDQYLDAKGREYFSWQASVPRQGEYNLHLWQPFISAADEVLDFGCGGGFLLRQLRAARKVGVEINPHARRFGLSQGTQIVPTVNDVDG